MLTLNGHVLAALDLETTGEIDGYHEIIQVSVVPLTPNLDPWDKSPFMMHIRPEHPERAQPEAMKKHGITLEFLQDMPDAPQVADCLDEWWKWLDLPMDKKLIALTHNGQFDIPFMKHWLGFDGYHTYFTYRGRDSMEFAAGLNDAAAWKNKPLPFHRVGLKQLCKFFGVQLDDHHDALADCLATAKVYRELLRFEQ